MIEKRRKKMRINISYPRGIKLLLATRRGRKGGRGQEEKGGHLSFKSQREKREKRKKGGNWGRKRVCGCPRHEKGGRKGKAFASRRKERWGTFLAFAARRVFERGDRVGDTGNSRITPPGEKKKREANLWGPGGRGREKKGKASVLPVGTRTRRARLRFQELGGERKKKASQPINAEPPTRTAGRRKERRGIQHLSGARLLKGGGKLSIEAWSVSIAQDRDQEKKVRLVAYVTSHIQGRGTLSPGRCPPPRKKGKTAPC